MSIIKTDLEKEQLRAERDLAIKFLAKWFVALTGENPNNDFWKYVFFEAMHGEHAIRVLLDEAIEQEHETMIKSGEYKW